jgi:hypothetical protein
MRKPNLAPAGRRARTIRYTAALLGALLAFGSLAPALALAKHESDTEGEGTSAPGALPGLEIGIGQESGGEETSLSEESVGPEESEIEEEVPAPELEEPEAEAAPAPASEAPPSPEPEVAVPVEEVPPPTVTEPAPPPPPPAEAPSYGVESSPPSYEPSLGPPPPSGEAVENETITGPTPPAPTAAKKKADRTAPAPSPEVLAEPEPASPAPVTPEPSPAPPAVVPSTAPDRAGSLAGKKVHLVASGECLWVIAAGYLPPGASNSEIAAEVHRLWRLNAVRIGTGDPDSLPLGVKLWLA